MSRRGRPRKPGPRTKNGRLKARRDPKDRGTDELQHMRAWLAGNGNPDHTCYPLGVLLANGAINEHQHEQGCRYAWLHAIVFGRPSIGAARWERIENGHDGDWNDEWLKHQTRRLEAVQRRLKQHPARLRSTLNELVIYERTPRWMRPVVPRVSDVREAKLLIDALDVLANHFEKRFDRAA